MIITNDIQTRGFPYTKLFLRSYYSQPFVHIAMSQLLSKTGYTHLYFKPQIILMCPHYNRHTCLFLSVRNSRHLDINYRRQRPLSTVDLQLRTKAINFYSDVWTMNYWIVWENIDMRLKLRIKLIVFFNIWL